MSLSLERQSENAVAPDAVGNPQKHTTGSSRSMVHMPPKERCGDRGNSSRVIMGSMKKKRKNLFRGGKKFIFFGLSLHFTFLDLKDRGRGREGKLMYIQEVMRCIQIV